MPYPTKNLSTLRTEIAQDIQANLPGTDPLLRFNNLQILGSALAGLVRELYGYLGWISLQAVPFTATAEWLEAWAAIKGVFRIGAASASGVVSFAGSPDGTTLPINSFMTRGDGQRFRTTASANVVAGIVAAPTRAVADPMGLTGAWGNCDVGVSMTLEAAVSGISSSGTVTTALTGGADLETDDALRARMLLAWQVEAHGGDEEDYITWSLAVAGVTRAWCVPHSQGAGTVGIFPMFDLSEAAHNGFPQGTDGVATRENRATPATGDQLAVANYLFTRQPVTALVFVFAPIAFPVNFIIAGTSGWTPTIKAGVESAIDAVFVADGAIDDQGGTTTVPLADLTSAIGAVPGTSGFTLTSPNANVVVPFGKLPTRGTMTYNP